MLSPGPKDDVELILEEYELNIVTVLYILTIMTKCLKNPDVELDDEDVKLVYKYVVQLNKMDLKLRDHQTLLHLACNGVSPVDDFHTNDVCRFPNVDTVKLLLHCGAQAAAFDYCRNTPLHTLTSTAQSNSGTFQETIQTVEAVAAMLVEAGVHVDAVNSDGLKASQVTALGLVEHRMKHYEVREITLQCLASRCIAKHNISYSGNIPKHLEPYVFMHCADKVLPD
jgi:Fem-1 homolog b